MSDKRTKERRFLVDRMLGPLCRYLRFMGYDTECASSYREGNKKEDTLLLTRAQYEHRILLTKDRELAKRGENLAILMSGEDVIGQIRQLTGLGLIDPELRLNRCSICNEYLRKATREEIKGTEYAPQDRDGLRFYWCRRCRKLYWMGSHGRNLEKRIRKGLENS
ncbi:MAG TPA: Mut7-C RNAse domain-containing protein [Methanoregulaceae archaeon]|nr:Mut7-C RNAse domain-containing protein [Methanoregulaceae archaeon]